MSEKGHFEADEMNCFLKRVVVLLNCVFGLTLTRACSVHEYILQFPATVSG